MSANTNIMISQCVYISKPTNSRASKTVIVWTTMTTDANETISQ